MTWNCSLCRIELGIETIEEHLSRNHLLNNQREDDHSDDEITVEGGPFQVWSCSGENSAALCRFKAGNFESMARHCLRERHDPTRVRRAPEFDAYHENLFGLLKNVLSLQKPSRKRCRDVKKSSEYYSRSPSAAASTMESIGNKVVPQEVERIDWQQTDSAAADVKPSLENNNDKNDDELERSLFKIKKSTFSLRRTSSADSSKRRKKIVLKKRRNLNLPDDILSAAYMVDKTGGDVGRHQSHSMSDISLNISMAEAADDSVNFYAESTENSDGADSAGVIEGSSSSEKFQTQNPMKLNPSLSQEDIKPSTTLNKSNLSLSTNPSNSNYIGGVRKTPKSERLNPTEIDHPLIGRIVEFFPSTKGAPLALIDNRIYHCNRKMDDGKRMYWTCETSKRTKCKATVKTDTESKVIVEARGEHTCGPPIPERVEAKRILGYYLHSRGNEHQQKNIEDLTAQDILNGVRPEVLRYLPKLDSLRKCLARAKFRPYFKPYSKPIPEPHDEGDGPDENENEKMENSAVQMNESVQQQESGSVDSEC